MKATQSNREQKMTEVTNPNQYQHLAMRTKKELGYKMNMIHAALGANDETGEFAKEIKDHLVYGKDFDFVNTVMEIGDALWYLALACETMKAPLSVVMEANIAKLNVRYQDGYSDAKALNRTKELEREAIAKVLDKYGIPY